MYKAPPLPQKRAPGVATTGCYAKYTHLTGYVYSITLCVQPCDRTHAPFSADVFFFFLRCAGYRQLRCSLTRFVRGTHKITQSTRTRSTGNPAHRRTWTLLLASSAGRQILPGTGRESLWSVWAIRASLGEPQKQQRRARKAPECFYFLYLFFCLNTLQSVFLSSLRVTYRMGSARQ